MQFGHIGTLKVRGAKENMKKFLLGAFTPYVPSVLAILQDAKPPAKIVTEDERSIKISADGFYVNGTRGNYVLLKSIEWAFDHEVLVIKNYRSVGEIDTEGLRKLSEEYQVDLKIYGFGREMEYDIDFEVHRGEIIKCDEIKGVLVKCDDIKFSDYDRESIDPELGG